MSEENLVSKIIPQTDHLKWTMVNLEEFVRSITFKFSYKMWQWIFKPVGLFDCYRLKFLDLHLTSLRELSLGHKVDIAPDVFQNIQILISMNLNNKLTIFHFLPPCCLLDLVPCAHSLLQRLISHFGMSS